MGMTYKESGVDIKAGEELVNNIKSGVASTHNKNVLGNIGLFGGFYKIPAGYKKPVLVSSVDGVGTKLKVAFMMNKHDTIGQDLVNHCVNDIAVCGAKPLYFLDYLGTGKLEPKVGEEIIRGMVAGCKENDCALIGGETAEMPGFYQKGEYDVSGTIVGIVEEDQVINGSKIKSSDVLIGLPSTGLHTNGYSLARKVLFEKYKVSDHVNELGMSVGEALLQVHRSYLKSITKLVKLNIVQGMSHVTGGGIIGNTKRIIPEGLNLSIDWQAWDWPAIFQVIQKEGNVPLEDMRQTFNLGVGLIFIVKKDDMNQAINALNELGEKPLLMGEVK